MTVRVYIKKGIEKLKVFFQNLALKDKSPHVLSLSFCVGVFVAFSPFVGLHTVLIFLLSWLFSLNFAVTLSASLLVNNPWTMVPVYSVDYFFGDWFFGKILGVNSLSLNPSWMEPLNGFVYKYTGISGISFWSFMVGGNLLGLLISAMLYPVVRLVFERILEKRYRKDTRVKW